MPAGAVEQQVEADKARDGNVWTRALRLNLVFCGLSGGEALYDTHMRALATVALLAALGNCSSEVPDVELPTPREFSKPALSAAAQVSDFDDFREQIVRHWLAKMRRASPPPKLLCVSELEYPPLPLVSPDPVPTVPSADLSRVIGRFAGSLPLVRLSSACANSDARSTWSLLFDGPYQWEGRLVMPGQVATADNPLHEHLYFTAYSRYYAGRWTLTEVQ